MCNCQPKDKDWIVPDFITVDMGDVCIECERDTSFGSGYFVNRLPADRMVEDDDVTSDGQSCTGSFPIEKDWFGKDAITNLYRKAKTITDTHYNSDEELRLDKSLRYSTNLRSTWPWLK